VEAVTAGSRLAFAGMGDSRDVVQGGAAETPGPPVGSVHSVVSRDYARVLGLPLLSGRDFTDAEVTTSTSERVAIVDDVLARAVWPDGNAVSRLIKFLDDESPQGKEPMRVVGVIAAVKHSPGSPEPASHVYVPLGQHYEPAMKLVVRLNAGQDAQASLDTITRLARDVDERVPILSVATWRDHLHGSVDLWTYRAGAGVFATFGGIALLLAVLGVYGVKSYVVSRRMREFGIRVALGAHSGTLLWQVMREGGRLAAIGIGLGLVLAVLVGQFLQGILYGVTGSAPVVFVTAPLVLLAAALLASYLPARRATRVDPTVALRAE
jgi:hypothetical protein